MPINVVIGVVVAVALAVICMMAILLARRCKVKPTPIPIPIRKPQSGVDRRFDEYVRRQAQGPRPDVAVHCGVPPGCCNA